MYIFNIIFFMNKSIELWIDYGNTTTTTTMATPARIPLFSGYRNRINLDWMKNKFWNLLWKVKDVFKSKSKKLKFEDYFEKVDFDPQTQELFLPHDSHPINSDWMDNMQKILEWRIKEGFTKLGVFDHNTLVNIYEWNKVIAENNMPIELINWIEISVWWQRPGHLILMDFDLEEFSSIFYEKYIIDYKTQRMWEWWFQPSRKNTKKETLENMELIMEMKRDPVYKYIIFPWDSPEVIFKKLIFHKKKWNISQLPIIYIPHPTLGAYCNPRTSGIKSLEKQWLTTYGWIFRKGKSSIEDRKNQASKIEKYMKMAKKINEEPVVMYEMWTSVYFLWKMEQFASKIYEKELKQLWVIPVLWPDIHNDMQRKYWFVFPKWVSLREWILANRHKMKITEPIQVTNKTNNFKVKDATDHIKWGIRWLLAPLCNEFPNLDWNIDDSLKIYKVLNSLDSKKNWNNLKEFFNQIITSFFWKMSSKLEYAPSLWTETIWDVKKYIINWTDS